MTFQPTDSFLPASVRSIAFVDSGISDADILAEGLSNHHVIQLPSDENGIEEITRSLNQYQNLDSIHIFSHGADGRLQLGNALLNQAFLSDYQNDLARWGESLTATGDILFYGCNLASSAKGRTFINSVSQLTQADVAASDDITGLPKLGGDWDLEISTGSIEATVALDQAIQDAYQAQLNLLTNGSFEATAIDNDRWAAFDARAVAGWQSLNGERIELWDSGHNGVASTDGSNHMELDYRRAAIDAIYQDIQTEAGEAYTLSFDIRARRSNFNSDDEAAVVEWNGRKLKVDGFKASGAGVWTTITTQVVGTGGRDRLLFRESVTPGASNGLGPLLDNIVLQKTELVANGSFEATAIDNDRWAAFDARAVAGWQSLNGERIELWDSGHNGVASTDGSNHMELDYRRAALDGIYQDLQTRAGQTYTLSFDIRSRRSNFNSDDEAAVVEWNGQKLKVDGFKASGAGVWTTITTQVVGTGGRDRLLFRESVTPGASNGLGPLLDNISLKVAENNPPVQITSNGGGDTAVVTVDEGVKTVTDFEVNVGDRQVNYVINDGDDRELFTIDPVSGQLSFIDAPDWETPRDADRNNVYEVNVVAAGATSGDGQFVTVIVNNLENPDPISSENSPLTITNPGNRVLVQEGKTYITDINVNDAEAAGQVLYQINGGADRNLFTIDSTTGVLSFKEAKDWENPIDVGRDNNYEVNVLAIRGNEADSKFLTVTVADILNEALAPVSVYLMAGQSNMAGEGRTANLSDRSYLAPFPQAQIWSIVTQSFVDLASGFDGQTTTMGPELSFGRRIVELTNRDVHLVKYALGATSLEEDWNPDGTGPQYNTFVQTVDNALANLAAQGIAYDVAGFVWQQGENDTFNDAFAPNYQQNLTEFIARIRGLYGDELAVSVGKLRSDLPTSPTNRAIVQAAQAAVAAGTPGVSLLDTDRLGPSAEVTRIAQDDTTHYSADGQVALGIAHAEILAS